MLHDKPTSIAQWSYNHNKTMVVLNSFFLKRKMPVNKYKRKDGQPKLCILVKRETRLLFFKAENVNSLTAERRRKKMPGQIYLNTYKYLHWIDNGENKAFDWSAFRHLAF